MEHYEESSQPRLTRHDGSKYTISGKTITFNHIDLHHPDELVGVTEEMYKAAWPTVEGVKGSQVIVSITPKGDNHFFDLWSEVIASVSNYLKEWTNLHNQQETKGQ
jgi:hypothetical protein